MIPFCQEKFEHYGREYWKYNQLAADSARRALSGKFANGVSMTAAELKAEKENTAHYKERTKNALYFAKEYERRKKKYDDLLKMM